MQTLLDRSFPSDIHAIVLTEQGMFDFSDAVYLITLATFSVLAYMFSWWSLPYTSKRQKQKSWKSNDFLTRFITAVVPLLDFKCSHGFASWRLFLIVNSEKKNTIGEKGLIEHTIPCYSLPSPWQKIHRSRSLKELVTLQTWSKRWNIINAWQLLLSFFTFIQNLILVLLEMSYASGRSFRKITLEPVWKSPPWRSTSESIWICDASNRGKNNNPYSYSVLKPINNNNQEYTSKIHMFKNGTLS